MTTDRQDSKVNQYDATVIDFVKKDRGSLVVVSDDQSFLSVVRNVLGKQLGLNSQECLSVVSDADQVLRVLKHEEVARKKPVLLMERRLAGQDMTFLVRQFKAAYPKLMLIIITMDVERTRIMYLHEVGADNFIAKPVSAKTIIEKLAFTIKPQTKLGQTIDIAKGYLQENKPQKAKAVAIQILELKPGSAAGLMVLGDAEMAMGNMDAAKEAYKSASDNADMYLEPLRKLALLAQVVGNQQESLLYLKKLDRLSPLNSERKVSMGEIHLNLGNESEAQELFELAVEQATRDALGQVGAVAERIAAIYADKDPVKSELFLRRALNLKRKFLSREDVRLFNQLGISLRQQGKWEEAITEYRQALEIAPDDENLFYNLGMAHAEGRQFSEARKAISQALLINENLPASSAGVAYNVGVVFLKAGVTEKAREFLNLALELNPDMHNARAALEKLPY